MKAFFLPLLFLATIASASEPVELRLQRTVLFEGDSLTLLCIIPPEKENRKLFVGIQDYRRSEIPLEGEKAPKTTQITYPAVPCGAKTVFCGAEKANKSVSLAVKQIEVVCLDQEIGR